MSILFKNARLIDPEARTETTGDLFVQDGVIAAVGDTHDTADQVVDCRGKHLAPGIVDIGVKICEPGERHKESFRTAGLAAAAGGVTTIVTRPDTLPEPALERLARLAERVPVWVELGLECADDARLVEINRLHTVADYVDAAGNVISILPGRTWVEMPRPDRTTIR